MIWTAPDSESLASINLVLALAKKLVATDVLSRQDVLDAAGEAQGWLNVSPMARISETKRAIDMFKDQM